MRAAITTFLLAISTLLSAGVYAAPGDLDPAFGGGDGWLTTGFGQAYGDVRSTSTVLQPDGKLLLAAVVGNAYPGKSEYENCQIVLLRFNADRTLDSSFGTAGEIRPAVDVGSCNGVSMARQSDGKLVLARTIANGTHTDAGIFRLNADGALDTSFSGDGLASAGFGSDSETVASVFIQADGRIVAVGDSCLSSGSCYGAIFRFYANGTPDSSFSADGKHREGPYMSFSDGVQQADGKLAISGRYTVNDGNGDDMMVARFNTDGSLDSSFGSSGKWISHIGTTGNEIVSRVIQQLDGKIVMIGMAFANDGITNLPRLTVVRLNAGGSLDNTFAGDGSFQYGLSSRSASGRDVMQLASGALVAVGSSYAVSSASSDGFMVLILNSDGTLASSSIGGDSNVTSGEGISIHQESSNNLWVVGTTLSGTDMIGMIKYGSAGNKLSTGVLFGVKKESLDRAKAVIQQSDGKLVALGSIRIDGGYNAMGLVRYNPDGSLDSGFDGDGKVINLLINEPEALILQTDGKLVVAGVNNGDFALARYNSDGALDTAFDGDGLLTTDFLGGFDYANTLIQQSNGKLVVAGCARNANGNDDIAMARYNSDGSLDTSFSGDGKLTTAVVTARNDCAHALIQQADGKLLVAGSGDVHPNSHLVLVRYQGNGSLDLTFDGDGKLVTNYASIDYYGADTSLLQQPDGKIVVAGRFGVSDPYTSILRYSLEGVLDNTFGVVTTPVIGGSLAMQSDGKFVISGYEHEYVCGYYQARLMAHRYNADGISDSGFNFVFPYDFFPVEQYCDGYLDVLPRGIVQQQDGRLVVVGWFERYLANYGAERDEFFLARIESGQLDTDGDGVLDALDSDDDNDGMPDSWENTYGLNPLLNDTAGNPDGDGYTNLQEYQNGTDPTLYDGPPPVTNDFDADADSDLFWRDSSSGANLLWVMQNGAVSVENNLGSNATTLQLVGIGDFDADGDDDVLFRDSVSGSNVIWLLQNGLKVSVNVIGSNSVAYTVAGVADFDRDGDEDIYFRDNASGANVIWTIQNGLKAGTSVLGNNATSFAVKGVADFDKDGDADILFRDDTSGQSVIWTLQNAAKASAVVVGTNANTYLIVGVADFDKDGDADILFRNNLGSSVLWKIQNAVKVSGAVLGTNATSYVVVGTPDLDGDGDADILFRNNATGQSVNWKMQNGAKVSGGVVGTNASSYSLAGMADCDGDGDADLLFRDGAGNSSLWIIQNAVKASENILASNAATLTPYFEK